MAARTLSLLLVVCSSFLTLALAGELELDTPDQHLEWSRRVDQDRDPQVTGATGRGDDVQVDVRQRQCLPAHTPAEDAFAASTGADDCR